MNAEQYITKLLESADIRINGDRPWDLKVHNKKLYQRVIRHGTLGIGEAYMDRWWDAEKPDELFCRAIKANLHRKFNYNPSTVLLYLESFFINQQTKNRAREVGRRHYDIGNDLYRVMLDRRMVYTCAYWQNAGTLDEAQEGKLDLVCRKLGLKPGQRVLDIGCGWGSFAKYAAENYGAEVVGITVSEQQAKLARELCSGLPVEVRLEDYRDLNETFDHIVSLGMIEHVGIKNYRNYFRIVSRCLAENGLFVLQTIGSPSSVRNTNPWIHKYIFPNSMLPSASQLSSAFEGRMIMEDWQNFGADYDKTLMAWFENFREGWEGLKNKYGDRFYRMWTYYLLMSAGSFRARSNQLWQIVFSRKGVPGGFGSILSYNEVRTGFSKSKKS